MSEKSVHIVFQVINFLTSDYCKSFNLLPIDKLILIILATHHGEMGIFPNQATISKRSHTSLRYTKARLKHLEAIGIISIKRMNRKNHYFFEKLSTIGEPQITYPVPIQQTIGELQITSQVNHRSPHRGSTDHTNNSINNQSNKTERATTLPSYENFEISKQSVNVAMKAGLTQEEANHSFEKFHAYYESNQQEKADWNAALQHWFMREGEYKKKKGTQENKEEVRSTVPWFNPEHASARGMEPVARLLNGLAEQANAHMNGGSPNGLGSDRQGAKAKD